MILDLPPQLESTITQIAQAQGISAHEWVLTTLQKSITPDDEERAYYEWFYRHHFDIERLKEAIGETDENGRAKNTITIPKGLAKDPEAFRAWIKANAS